jgi:adenylate cyclase
VTVRLRDLQACFEGVIPSIISTAAADGTPNISYLSHVVMVNDEHVALSNQFFAKTAANIRANPNAALLLVDARDGAQFRLDVTWVRSLDDGPLFEQVATALRASSAQVGMLGIMRLKAVDIFRVNSAAAVADMAPVVSAWPVLPVPDLTAIARLAGRLGAQTDAEGIVSTLLEGVRDELGFGQAVVLLNDETRNLLTTIASSGYERTGVGSEVPLGDGLIGAAAATMRTVKINDLSRIRRLGAAIEASSLDENRTRTIPLPGLPDALSQIAVPMTAHGSVRGVLFVESRERLAFSEMHAAALEMIAAQAAASLAISELLASEAPPVSLAPVPVRPLSRNVQITHHRFDDSVFIDNVYVIKGVAGRLLVFMLKAYVNEGRSEFTNREMRLSQGLRLPDIKDNLETRLLLLRRRLEEKSLAVKLIHTGRGRVGLELDGTPIIDSAGWSIGPKSAQRFSDKSDA